MMMFGVALIIIKYYHGETDDNSRRHRKPEKTSYRKEGKRSSLGSSMALRMDFM